jgi:1,2-diacylglycerol 3-alpha-glucosyltransferase
MKILMATNSYAPHIGGLEKSISIFAEELENRGNTVRILAPDAQGEAPDEARVFRVPALRNIGDGNYSLRIPGPGMVEQAVGAFRPDLIHTHHPYVMGGSALRLARQLGTPLVFTYHTMYEKYAEALPFSGPVLRRLSVEYPLRFANLSDHVIAPSRSLRSMLIERGLTVPSSVVPTGIEVARFRNPEIGGLRERLNIPEDAFVIGHLGRISAEKRVVELAKKIAAFLAEDSTAHMVLTGDGPQLDSVTAVFRKCGVEERFHATGALTGDDVVAAYHTMDVFTFASDSETQGLVLAEAMAGGLPVIAVEAPVVGEIVEDRVNGRLVSDFESIPAALRWFRELSQARRDDLSSEAVRTSDEYTVDRSVEALIEIYEKVGSHNTTSNQADLLDEVQGYLESEIELFSNFSGAIVQSILTFQ